MRRLTAVAPGLLGAVLLLVSLWVYWPGVPGPALLDDRSSVLTIGDVGNNPELAWDYIFGDTSGLLGRSVSMSTFVLEKMYLDEGVAGGKKVNIVLHMFNGALVIWLFALLFRFQAVPGYQWLAVLLGSLWLLHPLLVSTVLYVVQRMAMLSTFFMLLGSISYVYWRTSLIKGKPGLLRFLPVPVFLAVGMLAKENAIVLVPVLLLMEALWFRFAGPDGRTLVWLRNLSYGLIGAGAVVMLLVLVIGWDMLAADFRFRPFSLYERLLSQARILWDYVGQLFYPEIGRMGLYHDDFAWSRAWYEPVSTLYAAIAWLVLLLTCAVLLRWESGRWLVFGISWFLVGHSVESTVLPLEMYFEHRNYFPAMGLALSLGALFAIVARRWPEPVAPMLASLGLILVLVAGLCSTQVQVWSNHSLLLLTHLNGHPRSARANIDMAQEMAVRRDLDAALVYSKKALEVSTVERSGDYEVRNLALSCIANKPVPPEMIDNLGKTDPHRPLSSVTTLLAMVRMVQDDKCPTFDRIRFADRMAEIYLVDDFRKRGSANMYSNLAVLENALQRYDNAYAYVDQFLALSRNNTRGLLMKLHFATALGRYGDADEVIAILQDKNKRGQLNVGEQENLALYLEK